MAKSTRILVAATGLKIAASALPAAESRYMEDFAFLEKTIGRQGAAVDMESKGIDWKKVCREMEPAFEAATSDEEHVRNVMRLLAKLKDSHTGISNAKVKGLPSKWDGLFGGGLWFAWEDGRIMLRGVMDGHPLEAEDMEGAALVAVGGEPAWEVMARERARITEFRGSSSDHSLFSSMGNRFLPFGDADALDLTFVTSTGKEKKAKVRKWGPGGKAFYPTVVELPEGLDAGKGAVSTMLSPPWCEKVGYLRITGSMNEETAAAFHKAFDKLQGMEVLLLDCRSMGGGSDLPAWEMAGRLFAKAQPNGRGRKIAPSGSWQFDGPVVVLQNESMVSSAETFTWAVCEAKRVVSVGRPTGGWAIIPKGFSCPSGLVSFRLGVHDRGTPVNEVHTEGVGWPPDVLVPYGPVFCAKRDPEREIGMAVLKELHAGAARDKAIAAVRSMPVWKEDLRETLKLEAALLDREDVDLEGSSRRLKAIVSKARKAGLDSEVRACQSAFMEAKSRR